MTSNDNQLSTMKSIWTIPSIISGLSEVCDSLEIFAPVCEPFWSAVSKFELCRSVPTSCRGVELACEKDYPAVVFVPNRQIASVISCAQNVKVSSSLVLVVEDHPIIAPQLSPRELSSRAGLCVVEPCDPSEVIFCANAAAKLSIASKGAIVLVAHHGLLGGFCFG